MGIMILKVTYYIINCNSTLGSLYYILFALQLVYMVFLEPTMKRILYLKIDRTFVTTSSKKSLRG